MSDENFSLTLTLSRWEREQQLAVSFSSKICRATDHRHFAKTLEVIPPSPSGRVAQLGIAQRRVSVKYKHKSRNWNRSKRLEPSIKTIGDWIQVKRLEKNLTPGHVALKMGIATALVLSWEEGLSQPNQQQIKILEELFGAMC